MEEKQYVRSERAHFMCPNMHFGIVIGMDGICDFEKVKACLGRMSEAHSFLRSRMAYEKDSTHLFYEIKEDSQIEIYERDNVETLWEDYKAIGSKAWDVFQTGLLKVFLYPLKEEMKVLFVAHHLLGDGRCLLEIASEFATLYRESSKPTYVMEKLIQGIEDLPAKSDLTGVSKYLVRHLNNKWRKENKQVTHEAYIKFVESFTKLNPVSYETCALDSESVTHIKQLCKSHQLTVNDWLMAKMYLTYAAKKIIIAADIRSKLACYRKGALGNYATAMGIVCKGKSQNVIEKAKEVKKQVQLHTENNGRLMLVLACYLSMDETLIDAAAIAILGDFQSKAGKFVGGNMFGYLKRDGISLTNLGQTTHSYMKEAIFIPPASPATIQTIGALTVNGKMQLCSSYYTKIISTEKVKMQLQAIGEVEEEGKNGNGV